MIHHGDCLEVMAGLEPESVDAIVTDPPYGLEFMGKAWDSLGGKASSQRLSPAMEEPAWEPVVMARKPGPLRMLAIDECRIGTAKDVPASISDQRLKYGAFAGRPEGTDGMNAGLGRWPANVILTDPIFDGGWDGVVGGGEVGPSFRPGDRAVYSDDNRRAYGDYPDRADDWSQKGAGYGDSGTYSRFFLIPKADRADREPVLGDGPSRIVSVWGGDDDDLTPGKKSTVARRNVHPTVKPTDLMRHLIRLVTPTGGTVLDPFLGSGTTAIAAEMEGFEWIGIEKEAEYVAIAEARLNGTQRGLGLPA